MELHGEVVIHKIFGKGQIIEFTNNYVTVLFEESKDEKRFVYPTAFGRFLELEDKSFNKQIKKDKKVLAEKKAEIKKNDAERLKLEMAMNDKANGVKSKKGTTAKATDRNNIAFKCNYCDGGSSEETVGYKGVCSDDTIKHNINQSKQAWCRQPETMCYKYLNEEVSREEVDKFYDKTKSDFSKSVCYESQMLEIWNVGAGVTKTGDMKGKPKSLRNVKANSLALLTTKFPNTKEKDRSIFSVFIIDKNYESNSKTEGYVEANTKYRIQLSPDEAKELKFWDYYFNPNKPERIVFGSGQHRYITDDQSVQVLMKICEIKLGTKQEELSKELLKYYCSIKGIDIDNIPMPSGPLQRTATNE